MAHTSHPRISYFGPAGTFSEMALHALAEARGLTEVDAIAATSPANALDMVREGGSDFACVPIESSVEGSVPATMDALVNGEPLQIFDETILDIAFTLATRNDDAPAARIAAYPVAAAQVRRSLEKLYPAAEILPATSNAGAAQDVRDGRADVAVTTPLACEKYGLHAAHRDVIDSAGARTRFVLVGLPAQSTPRTGRDRTAVVLDLPDEPGSLMASMNEFAVRGIDLTRIESRPNTDGPYWFYLDAAGHISDPPIREALRALHGRAKKIVFLGSWPSADRRGSPPPDYTASLAWLDALEGGR